MGRHHVSDELWNIQVVNVWVSRPSSFFIFAFACKAKSFAIAILLFPFSLVFLDGPTEVFLHVWWIVVVGAPVCRVMALLTGVSLLKRKTSLSKLLFKRLHVQHSEEITNYIIFQRKLTMMQTHNTGTLYKRKFTANWPLKRQMRHLQKNLQNRLLITSVSINFCRLWNSDKWHRTRNWKQPYLWLRNVGDQERFYWNDVTGSRFEDLINGAYKKTIQWKRNIFMLPGSSQGKKYIDETMCLFNLWVNNTIRINSTKSRLCHMSATSTTE